MLEPPQVSSVFERQSVRPLPHRNDSGANASDLISVSLLQSVHLVEPCQRLQVREGAQQSDVPEHESRFKNNPAK